MTILSFVQGKKMDIGHDIGQDADHGHDSIKTVGRQMPRVLYNLKQKSKGRKRVP